jgi:hypothetical protein
MGKVDYWEVITNENEESETNVAIELMINRTYLDIVLYRDRNLFQSPSLGNTSLMFILPKLKYDVPSLALAEIPAAVGSQIHGIRWNNLLKAENIVLCSWQCNAHRFYLCSLGKEAIQLQQSGETVLN